MKRDEELYRIEQILKAIDEVEERLYKLKSKVGPNAEARAVEYLKSRRTWFFDQFNS